MKQWMVMGLAVLLAMAGSVEASGRAAVRKQAEMSLLATGTIDIGTDGRVVAYALDEPDKLPVVARSLMEEAKGTWAFEPVLVDGKAVVARTKMGLRFVAKESDDGTYTVRIASADFRVAEPPEESASSVSLRPPVYPSEAYLNGVRGTVYVVLRFGRDGRVQQVFAEQVNLRVVDSERRMDRWRELLASTTVATAKRWVFKPPSRGEDAGRDSWSVRVPVDYLMHGEKLPVYGQWQAYIPGARQRAPWADLDDAFQGADALASGGIYPVGGGVRLLTPLGG